MGVFDVKFLVVKLYPRESFDFPKVHLLTNVLTHGGGEGMPKVRKERGLAQSILFVIAFWVLVAAFFAGMMHLLQKIDITGFVYNLFH